MSESFAEMFEESLSNTIMQPGSILEGTVVEISGDYVMVNAGLKSEGVIPVDQFYNESGELTEASACNVYVVKDGVIATPETDHQILPGITRLLLIKILRAEGSLPIEERSVSLDELHNADEVWISSSTKEIAPVVTVDGKTVGDGQAGAIWARAQTLSSEHKYDY